MSKQLKSGNAIVRLLLSHGEKIVMLAVVACVGLLIWSSMGHERLPDANEPAKLESNARSAEEKVKNMSWQTFPAEEKRLAEKANIETAVGVIEAVKPSAFPPFPKPLDARVLAPVGLRTDPVLLPPVELEVTSGSGLWASADPEAIERRRLAMIEEQRIEDNRREQERAAELAAAEDEPGGRRGRGGRDGGGGYDAFGSGRGGESEQEAKMDAIIERPMGGSQTEGYEDIRSTSWATVLARVPIQAEVQLYRDALASSRGFDEQRDFPSYKGYLVERAEIVQGEQQAWEEIALVKEDVLIGITQRWPGSSRVAEVVDERYSHPILTYPLPPMAVRSWGEDVTHSKMPLPSLEGIMETLEEPGETATEEGDEGGGFVLDPSKQNQRTPGRSGEYGRGGYDRGGYGGRDGAGRPGAGRPGGNPYGNRGGRGGGEYGERGGRGGGGYGGPAETSLPEFTWDQKTSHILFRYFDSTVEPGRRYRYRVKLAMLDVNYGAAVKTLDKEVSERLSAEANSKSKGYRFTEWSEASPIANIPLPGLIYLAGGKEASDSNYYDEPEARLIVKSLDSQHAAEVAIDDWYTRGSVINAYDKAKVIWASRFELEPDEDEPEFHFDTGMTLVDFYGGEAFDKKNGELTQPTRALIMDAAGRLTRQSELDELETVETYEAILERGKDESAGGRGGGRDGGYGGGRDGGFGGEGRFGR